MEENDHSCCLVERHAKPQHRLITVRIGCQIESPVTVCNSIGGSALCSSIAGSLFSTSSRFGSSHAGSLSSSPSDSNGLLKEEAWRIRRQLKQLAGFAEVDRVEVGAVEDRRHLQMLRISARHSSWAGTHLLLKVM